MKTFKLLINIFLVLGVFQLSAQNPPSNDDVCDAEQLFMFDPPTSGTTVDATVELGETTPACFTGNNIESVWYKFTAPNDGTDVRVTTDFPNQTAISVGLAVYEAPSDCANLSFNQEIACANQNGSEVSFAAEVEATDLTIGDTYYIQVDKQGTTPNGIFDIAVESIPNNDDLCDSETIFVSQGNPDGNDYTTLGASEESNEPVPGCFDDGINGSVWFDFTAPQNGEVDITTDLSGGSLDDTEIAVYQAPGNCSDLSTLGAEIDCNQDISTSNFLSSINLTGLTPGDNYYIQVDRWGSSDDGRFGIEVTTPAPSNDDICDAIDLNVGESTSPDEYTNLGASSETDEPVPGCFFGGVDNSVWFKFDAPANAGEKDLKVTTDFAGGTLDDTEVAVYGVPTDCTDPTTFNAPLACDQDSGNNVNFNSVVDLSSVAIVPGFTYYIQVNNAGASGPGSFGIEVDYTPPANDDACDAIDLAINGSTTPDQYGTFGATNEPNEPVPGCFNDGINGSVWFTFTAPSNGEASVTTDFSGGSLGDTEIAVYEAPTNCADLVTLGSEQGCNQDIDIFNGNFLSEVNLTGLTPNATYYIQVDRHGSADDGSFGIEVQSNLSTDNFNKTDFTFYPNPVKNILNVDIDQAISQYSIYNMAGKKVLKGSPESNDPQINVSSLQTGTYLVKISVDGKSESFRIIKE